MHASLNLKAFAKRTNADRKIELSRQSNLGPKLQGLKKRFQQTSMQVLQSASIFACFRGRLSCSAEIFSAGVLLLPAHQQPHAQSTLLLCHCTRSHQQAVHSLKCAAPVSTTQPALCLPGPISHSNSTPTTAVETDSNKTTTAAAQQQQLQQLQWQAKQRAPGRQSYSSLRA